MKNLINKISNPIKTKGKQEAQRVMVNVRVHVTLFENVQRCYQIQKLKRNIILWMSPQMDIYKCINFKYNLTFIYI